MDRKPKIIDQERLNAAYKESTQVGIDIWKNKIPTAEQWGHWRAWYIAARVINKARGKFK